MKSKEELRNILADQSSRDELIIQLYSDIEQLKETIRGMEKDIEELKNYKKQNPTRLRL